MQPRPPASRPSSATTPRAARQETSLRGKTQVYSRGTLRKCFKLFDVNGDGVISPDEFVELTRGLGLSLPPDQLQELFASADTDASGELGIEEFVTLVWGKHPVPRGALPARGGQPRQRHRLPFAPQWLHRS